VRGGRRVALGGEEQSSPKAILQFTSPLAGEVGRRSRRPGGGARSGSSPRRAGRLARSAGWGGSKAARKQSSNSPPLRAGRSARSAGWGGPKQTENNPPIHLPACRGGRAPLAAPGWGDSEWFNCPPSMRGGQRVTPGGEEQSSPPTIVRPPFPERARARNPPLPRERERVGERAEKEVVSPAK
jgi:hypothetical protein